MKEEYIQSVAYGSQKVEWDPEEFEVEVLDLKKGHLVINEIKKGD